jgi:hypothetical protein
MHRSLLLSLAAAALLLCGCADPKPPVGRWQGVYEGDDMMVAARMEVRPDGSIFISAPDALSNTFATMAPEDRESVREKLVASLERSWPSVEPRAFKFDGKTFRKPDGVAPQMEWDAKTHGMVVIVYSGTHASVRVPLAPVEQFADAS